MIWVILFIVLLYSIVSSLEYISFYSRIAGKLNSKPMTGYAYQNIILTVSRFAFFFLMPALGYVVDKKIPNGQYLMMVLGAMILASIFSWISLLNKKKIIATISKRILPGGENEFNEKSYFKLNSIVFFSTIINFCYSMSFFITYFVALQFFDYRSTISNVAAALNGVASIISSFYIEPKISKIMDEGNLELTSEIIDSYLLGRLIAISFGGTLVVLIGWMIIL